MALSEHPNPAAAWVAAARRLLALEDPARASMVELSHEAYRPLQDVRSVPELVAVYRQRSGDDGLWERARQIVPALDAARACRMARDAAYYRRYRELLDGRILEEPPPRSG
ncbi:MAG TPA: hypothetical protein VHS99_21560 [Chloroflexota bacterium]|jgi:hypothetical protein|nr:hypothetical protein [Chloroflexota bacterium]